MVLCDFMEPDKAYFEEKKEKARTLYHSQNTIYCPFFQKHIVLNSDGFHHLQFSTRKERNKREQLLKFNLLPIGLEIIRKSGTVQEYRKLLTPIGKRSKRDGSIQMKDVVYWGLVAIVGDKNRKVRTVLRRIGDGNITFWSVMPYSKIKNGQQRIFTDGIEDE